MRDPAGLLARPELVLVKPDGQAANDPGEYIFMLATIGHLKGKSSLAISGIEVKVFSSSTAAIRSLLLDLEKWRVDDGDEE